MAVFLCLSFSASAAPWNQDFLWTPTDPNAGATDEHQYQYRVNAGAWSAVQSSPTAPVTINISIDHEQVIEVQGRPCASGLCSSIWLTGAYSVPPDMQPYSMGTITIGPGGWQKP